MDNYVVYKHTNKINGKIYIGITNNPKQRWKNGGIAYKPSKGSPQRPFWNAISKYGWDNFTHKIIVNNLSFEEAYNEKKRLIHDLHAQDNSIGYNVANGGNGGHIYKTHPKGMLGKHQTKHQKEVAHRSGVHATRGRRIMITYKDGTTSVYKTITLGMKDLHVSGQWISKRLSDELPYKFSKAVTSNVGNLKKLDGATFKYI